MAHAHVAFTPSKISCFGCCLFQLKSGQPVLFFLERKGIFKVLFRLQYSCKNIFLACML